MYAFGSTNVILPYVFLFQVKAYREYNTARKDPDLLTEEDRLMRQFACVERFATKLQIMAYMSTFEDSVRGLKPQVNSITLASKSLKNSKRIKRVLEIILAFGNYMNSTKKGPCYGFKLQSLDSLTITKSRNKKQTIVHYLADVVGQKYPDLVGFYQDITCLDKAAQYSLENLMTDLVELEKGSELTRRELENRLAQPNAAKDRSKMAQNQQLKDFVDKASEQVSTLRQEADRAQALFRECVEYFGENGKTTDVNTFFGYFVRFFAIWKQSELDNERRRKLEAAAAAAAANEAAADAAAAKEANAVRSRRNLQNALISELKSKATHVKPDEVKDGTLEDIILGLKSEPYRANVATEGGVRKSFRRQRTDRMSAAFATSESEAL